jgi:hypothetical protein
MYLQANKRLAEEDSDPEKDDSEALETPVAHVEVAHVGGNKNVFYKVHVESQNSLEIK